jgi:hypothetical protein
MRVTDSGGFGSCSGLTGFGGFGRILKPEYQMSPDVPIPCPTSPCELGKSLKLLRIVVGTLGHWDVSQMRGSVRSDLGLATAHRSQPGNWKTPS